MFGPNVLCCVSDILRTGFLFRINEQKTHQNLALYPFVSMCCVQTQSFLMMRSSLNKKKKDQMPDPIIHVHYLWIQMHNNLFFFFACEDIWREKTAKRREGEKNEDIDPKDVDPCGLACISNVMCACSSVLVMCIVTFQFEYQLRRHRISLAQLIDKQSIPHWMTRICVWCAVSVYPGYRCICACMYCRQSWHQMEMLQLVIEGEMFVCLSVSARARICMFVYMNRLSSNQIIIYINEDGWISDDTFFFLPTVCYDSQTYSNR